MRNNDAISAKEGTVYIIIDGKSYEYAELVSLKAEIKYIKADVKCVGKRMKGSKIVGAEGTGSIKVHYHRPENRMMALEYARTGKSPIMDIQAINADVTSRAGKQTTLLKDIVPDGALIVQIDGDSDDLLYDEFDFTFDDFDFLDQFKVIE
ncbi:phage tail tube protein [Schinkia azotoformans]|nr:phage tail tube protein [Schinkia azotoformans]MEC1696180.1 phage tail tube protein [Schinkia azotoformans]MEC1725317.1 phage tail tube protein [Schinkia azotoformans]MEC1779428.1 phage tail tube protein [Schinkia azotoformans]MED4330087.1 phage tail tube protein [Schinkia azotoformans]